MALTARVIIQMMGGPKKHLEQTLKMYLDKISEEHKDVTVLKRFESKAKKGEQLFNIFAELELQAKGPEALVWFCFDYMPASVEILEPDRIVYETHDFTNFLNDLQQKLHKVDMVVKNLSAENQVIRRNGTTLLKNIIIIQLRTGPKDLPTLAGNAGMQQEEVEKVISALIREGKILKDKQHYRIA